ncbi:Alpha/Beta hydrolase protein [Podospora conica]|nr:Alpha/Beta hydrolase protein [Schizothecium conicum]
MAKMGNIAHPPPHPRRRSASFEFLLGLLFGIPILASISYLQQQWTAHKLSPMAGSQPNHHKPPLAAPIDVMNPWPSLQPSPDLNFTPCYTALHPSFLCARLSLPMDPSLPLSPKNKVDIALVLLPAATANATGPPKPPLLINPGGPGGSGALTALLLGPALQVILGADQAIIGFDPRGVGETRPLADCWETTTCPLRDDGGSRGGCGLRRRLEWMGAQASYGTVASAGGGNTRYLVQGERGVNAMCSARDRNTDGGGVLRFAGTQFVARDMLGIVDAWGRMVGEKEGEGKLVYWGFSYGTYLGQVFARMFPERVGRVMLDGVVDAELYETEAWMESLVDADKVVAWFGRTCAEAKGECALYRNGDGAEDVVGRYQGLVERLDREPVVFTHPTFEFPVVLKEVEVRILMFQALYSPIRLFPPLAEVLNALHEEKWEVVAGLYADLEALCNPPAAGFPMNFAVPSDAQRAVMCADKVKPVNLTVAEIQALYGKMSKYSVFADFWTSLTLTCNGWDIFPAKSTFRKQDSKQVKTNHPLLFMSMTHDPVTPLLAAVKMALNFEDAGLLEVKSVGHATIKAASRCSAKIVREYINDGKLPPPPVVDGDDYLGGKWTTCEPDEKPWRPIGGTQGVNGGPEDSQDAGVVEAWAKVRATLDRMPKWGAEGGLARMNTRKTGLTPAMEDMAMGWKTGAGLGPVDMDELLMGF